MPGPLEALKKAYSIGPSPTAPEEISRKLEEVGLTKSMMPAPPGIDVQAQLMGDPSAAGIASIGSPLAMLDPKNWVSMVLGIGPRAVASGQQKAIDALVLAKDKFYDK